MAHLPPQTHDANPHGVMQGIPAPQTPLLYYDENQPAVPPTFSENLALHPNISKTEEGQLPHPLMMSQSKFVDSFSYKHLFIRRDMSAINLVP